MAKKQSKSRSKKRSTVARTGANKGKLLSIITVSKTPVPTVYLPNNDESADKLGDCGKPIEIEMLPIGAMFTVEWAHRPMGCTKGQTFMYLRCSNSDLWESKRFVIARSPSDIVSSFVASPILKPGDIVSIRLEPKTGKKQVIQMQFCTS